MDSAELILFLAVTAACAWLQAVSGFALALGLLGAMTEFHLTPIPVTAVVVSLLGLAGSLVALASERRAVQWRRLVPIALGMLPSVGLGVWLMDRLATEATSTLQVTLGVFIVLGGALMLTRPVTREHPAPRRTGLLAGLFGGLFGGLFAAIAPPVVYHLYREPMTVDAVRATLHALIFCHPCHIALHAGISPVLQRIGMLPPHLGTGHMTERKAALFRFGANPIFQLIASHCHTLTYHWHRV